MRASQLPLFTMKEDPRDAQVASHRLLVRAGFIRKQSAGLYAYLPFGRMVHSKVEEIVRRQMTDHGGVEVHMPYLTPAELWEESGRWSKMGAEMMRMQDRHAARFALGPTHEEAITWLAGTYLKSYRQLPLNLYQIGTKYRDEIRPRYGLIRCREFVMKDAYSFHMSDESLDETYQKMRECYRRIFEDCGLKTIPVQADSGNMGGSGSEEFMVASSIGEETLLLCEDEKNCGYRSNREKTAYLSDPHPPAAQKEEPAVVQTPGLKTVEEVSAHLKRELKSFIKTVILESEGAIVLAFLPGDRELNEVKLKNAADVSEPVMASAEAIRKVTGAEPGFAGPYGLPVKNGDIVTLPDGKKKRVILLADRSLKNLANAVSGANRTDAHITGLCEGRDFTASEQDLVQTAQGDLCPSCRKARLTETRGIEVGHIFKLGKKYTESMKLTVLDENGREFTPTMGCYGIGVGRTMATVVEQNHDEKGIIWPENITPFRYYLSSLAKTEEEQRKVDLLYADLNTRGISVFLDDRNERPGVKFNDADLVGFPYQLVAGKSFFTGDKLEFKERRSGEKKEISATELN